MRKIRDSKGFTLIELMIVVVIIGILAAIAIPRFTAVSKGAKEAEAEPILKQIRSLQESEMLKNNAYAASVAALPGWTDPTAEYYVFTTTATCAIATPISATEVSPRSMDLDDGGIHLTADCSGAEV